MSSGTDDEINRWELARLQIAEYICGSDGFLLWILSYESSDGTSNLLLSAISYSDDSSHGSIFCGHFFRLFHIFYTAIR